ncbi:MAG: type II toxin-antitoxin system HicA family toxin [Planctomycetes bacterium]|nr:type II toxin-antitoxin system HicA family toxin [Planctomycetota bacterium]
MKRRDLLRHLEAHGCRFLREGGSHSIWENPANGQRTSIPRHSAIPKFTARAICRQLGVQEP